MVGTAGSIDTTPPELDLDIDTRLWLHENLDRIKQLLLNGVDGSFTTTDGKTVTVTAGIITGII